MVNTLTDRYLVWIEIDLGAIRHNYGEVRRITGGAEVMAALKCNAYGHGAPEIARALAGAGVKFFAVASVAEALELRECGIEGDILNVGPFAPAEAQSVVEHGLVQAVFTMPAAEALEEAGAVADRNVQVHIKVDTGLSRLGVPFAEAAKFAGRVGKFPHVKIEGIFSSLTEDPEFDKVQLERLRGVIGGFESAGVAPGRVHLVASGGVIDFPAGHFDLVRPGIMLLGLYPNEESRSERKVELVPILSLKARVARVARLPKGESVSYRRKYVAAQDTCIATLPVGYTHGYPRGGAGRAEVLIGGNRYPVIADVPATAMFVDLAQDDSVREGDEAVLIGWQGGEEISADDLAGAAGLSNYQVVAALSPRLPRVYVDA